MKVDNKVIRQYANPDDKEHCIVNIFVNYLSMIPTTDAHFYYRSGVPKFSKQAVGCNKLAKLIPDV